VANHPNQPSSFDALILGLGNPGPEYSGNRHNIGQLVVDALAEQTDAKFKKLPGAVAAETRLAPMGPRVVLAKSLGYMNLSGSPTKALLASYKLLPSQLIVIHDELDIDFGDIRVKFDGGHAGHNGLRDISAKVGAGFHRIRFGIGRPRESVAVSDFVLQNFSSAQRSELPGLIADSIAHVERLVEQIAGDGKA
jgi:peptidyl-tRNA hydrolase, PTH1 family